MIKAKELRIGNWVSYFDKYYLVKGMRHENSSFYISGVENMNHLTKVYNVEDTFEPIPLTPEILDKCGFIWHDYYGWTKDKINFRIDPSNDPMEVYFSCGKEDVIVSRITSLHQLQNLYFALTGKELNIDLNAEVSDTNKA